MRNVAWGQWLVISRVLVRKADANSNPLFPVRMQEQALALVCSSDHVYYGVALLGATGS